MIGLILSLAIAADAPLRAGIFVGSNAAPSDRETLEYAEDDAVRMRQVFVELGGVAPENAILLTGASADQILAAIERLREKSAMLVFYYSGHADDRGLLLGASELSFADLSHALDRAPAQLSLRLIDACRSGALTRRKGAQLGERFSVGADQIGEGHVVITSSAEWEDSQESDRLGGSFFTLHLASALRGAADTDTDGKVTLDEAYRYVYGRTVESTIGTTAGAQHPTYSHDLSGRGEYVLTWTKLSGGTLLIGEGQYLVIDEKNENIVAEVESRASTRLTVAPGNYRVSKRTRAEVFSGRVSVIAGGTHSADDVLTERVAHARWVRKGGARDPSFSQSIRFAGGARGGLDASVGAVPLLRLGYELVLPWLSVEPYVSITTGAALVTPRLSFSTWELGVGLGVSRAIDFSWVTLRGGLLAELIRLQQDEADDPALGQTAWGGAFGASAGIEAPPLFDVVFGAAGEAVFYVYPSTSARTSPVGEGEIVTRPTYRLLLGARYEL